MQIKVFIRCFLFFLCCWLPAVVFAEADADHERLLIYNATEKTVAGLLKVIDLSEYEMPGSHYKITLNAKTIREIDNADESPKNHYKGFAIPRIEKHFKKPVAGFDEVVVFQQFDWGNLCGGTDIWFLGLKRDGTYRITDSVPFCGGKPAIIRQQGNNILVIAPGEPPNIGEGHIPTEKYIYSDGTIQRIQ